LHSGQDNRQPESRHPFPTNAAIIIIRRFAESQVHGREDEKQFVDGGWEGGV
jgi:hypothetical protein